MTTKKTTKTVTAKPAPVAKAKRPTIASLQEELTKSKEEYKAASITIENLENEVNTLNYSLACRNSEVVKLNRQMKELESRSIFAQILAKLSSPFK